MAVDRSLEQVFPCLLYTSHLQGGFHLEMNLDHDGVLAFALDRLFMFDRAAVHFHALCGEGFVNVLVGDGAERLAALAHFEDEVHGQSVDLSGHFLGGAEFFRFALGAGGLKIGDETAVGSRCFVGKTLRDEICLLYTSISGTGPEWRQAGTQCVGIFSFYLPQCLRQ